VAKSVNIRRKKSKLDQDGDIMTMGKRLEYNIMSKKRNLEQEKNNNESVGMPIFTSSNLPQEWTNSNGR
jgi:hypothetical protein